MTEPGMTEPGYSEENGLVVLRMTPEDYSLMLMILGKGTGNISRSDRSFVDVPRYRRYVTRR